MCSPKSRVDSHTAAKAHLWAYLNMGQNRPPEVKILGWSAPQIFNLRPFLRYNFSKSRGVRPKIGASRRFWGGGAPLPIFEFWGGPPTPNPPQVKVCLWEYDTSLEIVSAVCPFEIGEVAYWQGGGATGNFPIGGVGGNGQVAHWFFGLLF